MSDSAQSPAKASEMRDVQLQVRLGIQNPNQRTATEAHAMEAAASLGA